MVQPKMTLKYVISNKLPHCNPPNHSSAINKVNNKCLIINYLQIRDGHRGPGRGPGRGAEPRKA